MGLFGILGGAKEAYDEYVLLRKELEILRDKLADFERSSGDFVHSATEKVLALDRVVVGLSAKLEYAEKARVEENVRAAREIERLRKRNESLAHRVQALESRFNATVEKVLVAASLRGQANRSIDSPVSTIRQLGEPPLDGE